MNMVLFQIQITITDVDGGREASKPAKKANCRKSGSKLALYLYLLLYAARFFGRTPLCVIFPVNITPGYNSRQFPGPGGTGGICIGQGGGGVCCFAFQMRKTVISLVFRASRSTGTASPAPGLRVGRLTPPVAKIAATLCVATSTKRGVTVPTKR